MVDLMDSKIWMHCFLPSLMKVPMLWLKGSNRSCNGNKNLVVLVPRGGDHRGKRTGQRLLMMYHIRMILVLAPRPILGHGKIEIKLSYMIINTKYCLCILLFHGIYLYY